MATSIEWTDATWNPIVGCRAVSPGCANCYAARLAATRLRGHPAYRGLAVCGTSTTQKSRWTGDVRFLPDRLGQPLKWRKPRRIFVCDMGDIMLGQRKDIMRIIDIMHRTPKHTYQVLTKRPRRLHEFVWYDPECFRPFSNVWLGTTCENQKQAHERVPELVQAPATLRFLSLEPLLGPINLGLYGNTAGQWSPLWTHLSWVIVGGESGPDARPCHVKWIRSIVRQCREAGIPCFVKQLGSNYNDPLNGIGGRCAKVPPDVGRSLTCRFKSYKGNDPTEWPKDLRVREMPVLLDD
jgi:protein gp37